jgi:membrane protein required for colicin V production
VNWIDLILIFLLALFGLRGFFRGLFREVFSLLGLVVGFIAAVAFVAPGSAYAGEFWKAPPLLLKGAVFVAIFFVVYFIFSLIGWLLHRSERLLFLKTLNRAGGIAVGLGKGAAIIALSVFFLSDAAWLPKGNQENFQNSYLVSPLSRFARTLIRMGKDSMRSSTDGEHAALQRGERL